MANVAQLVEPRFVVPVVVGSSPIVRPRLKKGVLIETPFLFSRWARTEVRLARKLNVLHTFR